MSLQYLWLLSEDIHDLRDNTMDGIRREIIKTILKIEQYCRLLLIGKYDVARQYMPELVSSFSTLIPDIIRLYDEEAVLKDLDSSIWLDILNRVMEVIGTEDDFRQIDVLRMEMEECLKEYLDIIGEVHHEFISL